MKWNKIKSHRPKFGHVTTNQAILFVIYGYHNTSVGMSLDCHGARLVGMGLRFYGAVLLGYPNIEYGGHIVK